MYKYDRLAWTVEHIDWKQLGLMLFSIEKYWTQKQIHQSNITATCITQAFIIYLVHIYLVHLFKTIDE